MANLTPADTFDDVYKLETSDPVKAGTVAGALTAPTDGQTNAPIQSLTNRTYYLYLRMLPIGTVLPYVGTTAPTGFLVCNGASISRTTYAALFAVCSTRFGAVNGSNFNIPDMRGMFMRGWDNGAGVDPDAASRSAHSFGGATADSIGTEQADAFESHVHEVIPVTGVGAVQSALEDNNGAGTPFDTEATGGSETRPINLAFNFIIKALV
jgi:microcystin-dependent protein